MSGQYVLIDSSVPLYALGAPSLWREACQELLRGLAEERLRAVASTEMIQEVVHHRLRMTGDRVVAVTNARDLIALVDVAPFDEAVLRTALGLIETGTVRGRDAVHAATALTRGITTIVSTDPAFDDVPGLKRLDPLDYGD